MALPKSGKKDSNVTQLDDIRNKQKKSTRKADTQARSHNSDEGHVIAADFDKEAHSPRKVDAEQESSDVIQTPAKRSLVSNRRFDKVKVERIKAELANGSYQIYYLQVADKFIEHERFG